MSNKLAGFILANRHPHITCPPLLLLLMLLIIDQVMLQRCVMLARRQHTLTRIGTCIGSTRSVAASLAMLTLPLSIFHTSHNGGRRCRRQANESSWPRTREPQLVLVFSPSAVALIFIRSPALISRSPTSTFPLGHLHLY